DGHVTGVQTCALPISTVCLKHPRAVDSRVDAGGGGDEAPNRCDLFLDLLRRSPRGAFEGHMLQDMRNAIFFWLFVPTAGAHPNRSEERRVGKECRVAR